MGTEVYSVPMRTYTIQMQDGDERRTVTVTDAQMQGLFLPGMSESGRWLALWLMAEED